METHPNFKLNGTSFSDNALNEFANSLVKEGKPFEVPIGNFILDWTNQSKMVTVSTSGSTGKPKQIQLQKKHMVNSALATGSFFNLSARDSVLLCLPCDFIAGKMMLVRAMVLGLQIDVVEPSSNPLKDTSNSYDFGAMIPLQVQNSIDKLYRIGKLIIGGAPLEKKLENKLRSLKTATYETYGMTETITHIAVRKLEVSNFETIPTVTVKTDERGCLVINAPKITDEEVITNDVVELISDTEFKWLGRYDTIINSGGIKLIPEQIERKLTKIIDTRFFVAGLQDDTFGEKLVLVVEGDIDMPNLLMQIDNVNDLSKYEKPKAILNIEHFIQSANGKVLRSETLSAALKN
ncbi:AMP-binding protein [uncultured Croceitalea sp.]|uniref:AMP-binding protein n=1 Tax=uncultured Croceitalea sp. TaxID=1798908 RepID=UPI00374ECA6D